MTMMTPDFEYCMREYMLPKVEKGCAWLDETQPGWASKISLDDLKLANGKYCICGQLFGDYMSRPMTDDQDPADYGFTVDIEYAYWSYELDCNCDDCAENPDPVHDTDPYFQELAWETLDVLWSAEVAWRMS